MANRTLQESKNRSDPARKEDPWLTELIHAYMGFHHYLLAPSNVRMESDIGGFGVLGGSLVMAWQRRWYLHLHLYPGGEAFGKACEGRFGAWWRYSGCLES